MEAHTTIAENEAAKRLAAQKYLDQYYSSPDNYFRGAVGALSGAMAVAIPWALFGLTGYTSVWLSLFMAFMAGSGYDRAKGRADWVKLYLTSGAIIIGIIMGNTARDILVLSNEYFHETLAEANMSVIRFYLYNFSVFFRIGFINFIWGCLFATPVMIKMGLDIGNELKSIKKLRKEAGQDN